MNGAMNGAMNSPVKSDLRPRRIDALVIGASAGGIRALLTLLPALPAPCPFPVAVVLHLPDDHESRLAEVFQQHLACPVRQAADKEMLAPGTIYFAPPGYHLSIEREGCFSLSQEDPVHFSRPSIDILMESAADAYGPALAGIVLTGASCDGAAGLARIGAAGGLTLVQDPQEAEMDAMPLAAIRLRQPDAVLTLDALCAQLTMMEKQP